MNTKDVSPLLAKLPFDVCARIYSHLPPSGLTSLMSVSKAHREDIKRFVLEKPEPLSRRYSRVDWLELYLDSLAGLYLLDARLAMPKKSKGGKGDDDSEQAKDPVCVAAALVKNKKSKPQVIVTSNTRSLPARRTVITQDGRDAPWVVQVPYDVTLKTYVKAWLDYIDAAKIPKMPKMSGVPQTLRKDTRALLQQALAITPEIPDGIGYLHAEMQILDLLWEGTIRPIDAESGVVYIGLTLLCCRHCWRAIQAFNKCFAAKHKYPCSVVVAGTHDTPYAPKNWNLPQFLIQDKEAFNAFNALYRGNRVGFMYSTEPEKTNPTRPNVLELLD